MRQLIGYLRLIHGALNLGAAIFFIYQGLTGIRIRRERAAGAMIPSQVKKHRTTGPVLVILGFLGFISGITIVLMHFGILVKYPFHLAAGLALIFCLIATYMSSRKIKASVPDWRMVHFAFGLTVLSLYSVQVFLGLGILF